MEEERKSPYPDETATECGRMRDLPGDQRDDQSGDLAESVVEGQREGADLEVVCEAIGGPGDDDRDAALGPAHGDVGEKLQAFGDIPDGEHEIAKGTQGAGQHNGLPALPAEVGVIGGAEGRDNGDGIRDGAYVVDQRHRVLVRLGGEPEQERRARRVHHVAKDNQDGEEGPEAPVEEEPPEDGLVDAPRWSEPLGLDPLAG